MGFEKIMPLIKVADTVEIFGDSGTGKTTAALEFCKMYKGKKIKYFDTERNIVDTPEGIDYEYVADFEELYQKIMGLRPGYDLVIVDSLGLPVLGEFATKSVKEKGDSLLKAQAICYTFKKYSHKNNCLVLITNQPESEFNKSREHILRPFGDKSIYFFKEVWKTDRLSSTPSQTSCVCRAFRSRMYGMGTDLFRLQITKDGVKVV